MLWEIGPFRDIAASRSAFRKLQRKEFIRYDNVIAIVMILINVIQGRKVLSRRRNASLRQGP